MSIEAKLTQRMKDAMRARDKRTLGLIRMLKSKMTETRTAPGFSGTIDDALWLKVIQSYAKSQAKALKIYQDLGEAGAEHVEQLTWEVEALQEWLPQKADEATTQQWVDDAVAGLGGKERAKFGAVMGAVMKAHKAEADPALVRRLVKGALG